MADLPLVNTPISLRKSNKTNGTSSMPYSSQTSINKQDLSISPSIESNKTSSNSNSALTEATISKENYAYSDTSTSKLETVLKLKHNEAEFFVQIPPVHSNKSKRKCDKIRSAFHRKFHRSTNTSSNRSSNQWNEILAKGLNSMQNDNQCIISGLGKIDRPMTDAFLSNKSESHLSFRERQREKPRIGETLRPPNLLTYNMKESPYPYTDMIAPDNFRQLQIIKRIPFENLLVQCKPFRHRKLRHRTQHGLIRAEDNIKKVLHDIHGKNTIKLHKEISLHHVLNYRCRLEKTLIEFRRQMAEYDRIHSSMNNDQLSISKIITKTDPIESKLKIQIDDHRTKSRTIGYSIDTKKNELLSVPYIHHRTKNHLIDLKKQTNVDSLIDKRFDPTTFIDLNNEAKQFFGEEPPFWNKPLEARLSTILPLERYKSTHFLLPPKSSMWTCFVRSFRTKQKLLRKLELKQRQLSNDDLLYDNKEEFFDCSSIPFKERRSQSFNSLHNLKLQ